MLKAIFFDRDGTLIDEPETETVDTWEKFRLKEGLESLVSLRDVGFTFFIISNQEAIGEGGLSQGFYDATNAKLLAALAEHGIAVEKIYTCPHARSANCECRKPGRGLIDQALREYEIDVPHSYIIGDRPSDVELGNVVGLKTIYIESPWHKLPPDLKPNYTSAGLVPAVAYTLAQVK
jgi:histidinol-phosphatase